VLGGRLIREGVLQQSALSQTDAYCTPEKATALVEAVLTVIGRCGDLVDGGARVDAVEAVDFTPLLRAHEETGPQDTAGVAAARDSVLARLAELA
jgi:V/A-type H+-transporting ATPase subunit A